MDELTLLRNAREDIDVPQEALHRGRAALLERTGDAAVPGIPASVAPRSSRRRLRRFALGSLSAMGAAALVTGLVLTDVVGLAGWRGGADAAAASVLENASVAAIGSSDPVLAPGQYLSVRTRAAYRATVQREDRTSTFQYLADDTLFVPADRADDWVWQRGAQSVYATFGADSQAVADAWQAEAPSDAISGGDLLRAPAGAFYGARPEAGFDDLDTLPRDPYRLLNHIYRVTLGAGPSPDTEALVFLADRLRIGDVPADLRSAMYRAAAMIPGVTLVDDQATLDGHRGVAIGRDEEAWGSRIEIIVDPTTGTFLGEREILLRDQDGIPAGTAASWTAVTTSIVDQAPAGGTPCGRMAQDSTSGRC
ncbi:CU044_5270 family protein [Microbacterium flavum]|uniref:CU044_5270 family protein n=1 Tax=Microbacterium flavum TaxID=415216 RepID=A0ABS5XWK3_9MICO|nr:CU044_5270 family protein [Microbacterium flavum]MBT8798926.1 CU044_5270 family protein [Microbacterium flavum]